MRLGWIVLFILSFPVLEAIGIFFMADAIGAWVVLWLILDVVVGVALIRFERMAWGARLLMAVRAGQLPFSALFATGRVLVAGGLLAFPGFISDAIALALLLMPGTWAPRPRGRPAPGARDDVIQGEARRIYDDRLP